ncbi:uncharacterized protein LY79DRAFT_97475 [Colletotrichum navitas]|uniref:Uncharacterized protein n=1 Tax=Colletotrichum navitas TaxID=681940 RepID=A0AAD8PK81_9PEZI|nr:uncharacterized protein LY79DRAFT_97475 [Colletotrichum navitas]KAK1566317.1 hypothetical protein LY79DRAFT_97475 [Colletotrichum navitas]
MPKDHAWMRRSGAGTSTRDTGRRLRIGDGELWDAQRHCPIHIPLLSTLHVFSVLDRRPPAAACLLWNCSQQGRMYDKHQTRMRKASFLPRPAACFGVGDRSSGIPETRGGLSAWSVRRPCIPLMRVPVPVPVPVLMRMLTLTGAGVGAVCVVCMRTQR